MNERSPVGEGRSLTGPSPAGQEGQLTRGIFQGLVEIGGALCETRHAIGMGIECEVIGETLCDREFVGKENGGQLGPDLPSSERSYFSVTHTDRATESGLPGAVRFYAESLVASAVAGWDDFSEPSCEGLLITLDSDGKVTTVNPVLEVEIVRVKSQVNDVPRGNAVDIVELRTARSMFWKAHETNRAREGVTEPVALLERDIVGRADGALSQVEPNNNPSQCCGDTPCCIDEW